MMLHRLLAGLTLVALIPVLATAAPRPQKGAPANLPSNRDLTSRAKAQAVVLQPTEADWRTPNPDDLLVIDTNKGRIVVEMAPLVAPAHVAQIKTLARRHFYDGLRFFRVIDDFMAQTGDPQNTGEGGSDLPNLKAEFTFKRTGETPFVTAANPNGLSVGFIDAMPVASQSEDLMAMTASGKVTAWPLFCPGVAAMARAGDPDSANSQFFLMRDAYPSLTQKYTGWGRVIMGEDIVKALKVGEPVEAPQDKMLTVRLASDMPEADRPKVQVINVAGPYFHQVLTQAVEAGGSRFSVCDVEVPTRLKP